MHPSVSPEPRTVPVKDQDYMTPTEVAEKFKVSVKTVAHWRTTRQGPTPQRFGKHVRYLEADVRAWADEKKARGEKWMAE
jgi:predicted DNA-binding transcriptional regulator AlpA